MSHDLTILSLVTATAVALPAHAQQQFWVTYDPARGTVPTAQCWDLNSSSGQPAPTLSSGELTIGPSTYGGTLYYDRDASIDFARGAVMEADIFIVNSQYATNPCGAGQRAGTIIGMNDIANRRLNVGIGNGWVFLSTIDNAVVGSPLAPRAQVQCQGVWKRFRLEVASGTATLLIDGVPTLSVAVGNTGSTSRRVYFGDGSVCAAGHAKFGLVRFLAVDDCPADFNRDGFLDFFDYDAYVSCFEGGDCPCDQTADFNRDGFADFFDYDQFVTDFESGC
jgi:hypothetical protein